MVKRLSVLGIMFMSMLLVVGCGSDEGKKDKASDDETYSITISNSVEEDSALHLGLVKFKEVAEEKSEGRFEVEIFSNAELYASEREAVEAVQAGNIEMASPATAPLTNFVEDFMVLDFLFLFDDVDEAAEALDGELGDRLFESLESHQLKGLGWGTAGMTQLTNSKKPIESAADLKGMKIRTMENSIHLDSLEALGANPQPYAFGELYSALQQNIFDGMQTPAQLIESTKVYEVQDYMTVMNHSFTGEALIINKDFYDGLPEDLQAVLDEAGLAFTEHERKVSKEYDDKAMKLLNENLEVNELSDEAKQEMKEIIQPVFEKYEKNLDPELVKLIKDK